MLSLGNRRFSKLSLSLEAAPVFHLDDARARAIIAGQQAAIEAHWDAVCDEAALGGAERAFLWRRQFLNPFAFEGFAAAPNRSEEHTSELQSLMRISYAVFCLQKKKHTCK